MAITAGDNLNSVPTHQKQTLSTNYLDFTGTANSWGQQYLPDLMEQEAEVFGQRTISGFLAQVGAEEAMTSDQVVWSEQSRLHISVKGTVAVAGSTNGTFEVTADIDGNNASSSPAFTLADHGVRANDLCLVASAGITTLCLAIDVDTATIMLEPYDKATLAGHATTAGASTLLVVGSEYAKGKSYSSSDPDAHALLTASSTHEANEPTFKSFSNKPIIMKDYYEVSGSDASRIGWVEVSSEGGGNGYLWYLKAEADTRARFTDYLEMAMLESVKGSNSTVVDTSLGASADSGVGTQGLFDAIKDRGNQTSGVTGLSGAVDLAEFDAILAEFDSQGAIEENMMFVNRTTSLAMDDMLASMNSYGAGGTSYGVFNNSEDMALNLGFSGFRRGSYDFYKSDFRYLNDKATRGGINSAAGSAAIRGVVIPAGTSSVYDQSLGKSMKRPFLHVRYRASQTDNRKLKTWITGSVGAATSTLDAMQMNFLSERCLITQGANNFMLLT